MYNKLASKINTNFFMCSSPPFWKSPPSLRRGFPRFLALQRRPPQGMPQPARAKPRFVTVPDHIVVPSFIFPSDKPRERRQPLRSARQPRCRGDVFCQPAPPRLMIPCRFCSQKLFDLLCRMYCNPVYYMLYNMIRRNRSKRRPT